MDLSTMVQTTTRETARERIAALAVKEERALNALVGANMAFHAAIDDYNADNYGRKVRKAHEAMIRAAKRTQNISHALDVLRTAWSA